MLHEKNRNATTKSFMWMACGFSERNKFLFLDYYPTRSGTVVTEFLKGYAGYSQLGQVQEIIHVGFIAHILRRFFGSYKVSSGYQEAGKFLSMISAFYPTKTASIIPIENLHKSPCLS